MMETSLIKPITEWIGNDGHIINKNWSLNKLTRPGPPWPWPAPPDTELYGGCLPRGNVVFPMVFYSFPITVADIYSSLTPERWCPVVVQGITCFLTVSQWFPMNSTFRTTEGALVWFVPIARKCCFPIGFKGFPITVAACRFFPPGFCDFACFSNVFEEFHGHVVFSHYHHQRSGKRKHFPCYM